MKWENFGAFLSRLLRWEIFLTGFFLKRFSLCKCVRTVVSILIIEFVYIANELSSVLHIKWKCLGVCACMRACMWGWGWSVKPF
jgi:hypothetical protein